MTDILSRDEVEMLLTAVSDGEPPEIPVDSSNTSSTLLTAYDFRRPDRVSKEQLKGLQSLFEVFGRELGTMLPPFLRTVVRVSLRSIDQLTYDEFLLSVARPTSMSIVDMKPLDGRAVVELDPAMVFPVVDRVLGGAGAGLPAPRELTEIEDRIVYRLVLLVLDSWKRAWDHLVDLKMGVVNQESDPLIVQIVPGSEMVVLVGYEISIGDSSGSMNICIPLVVLSPVLEQISQRAHYQRKSGSTSAAPARAAIRKSVLRSHLRVEPVLGQAKVALCELAELQVGDVLPLDSIARNPIEVRVGGLARFLAKPGRRGDQRSVQIVSLLRP